MDSNAGLNSLINALPPEFGGSLGVTPTPAQAAPETAAPEIQIEQPAKSAPVDPVKADIPLKKGADAFDIEEEKPAEPVAKEDESDEPPADAKTPEAKNAWTKSRNEIKELKAALDAAQAEKARIESELSTKKGLADNDPVKVEYERLKAEREEWQKEAAKYRIEQTDQYKEAVTKPLQSISAAAAELAKRNEIEPEKVFDALRESDEKRQNEKIQEIADNLSERDKLRIWNMADELQKVYARQEHLEASAAEALKEAQANEAALAEKRSLEIKASEMRAVEDLRPKLAKAAHLFALEGEDAEAAVAKILTEANAVPFNEHDTESRAFSVVAATILPRLMKNYQTAVKERDSLKRELSEYSGASARTSDGAKKPAGQIAAVGGFDSVMQGISQTLAGLGIRQ